MPQLQPVVLTDRAATPVNHTFSPQDVANGVGSVVEYDGVPIGNNILTVGVKRNGVGNYKGTLTLTLPVVATETVNGVDTPKVVRTAYATLVVTFAPDSSEQERKDLIGMLASALDPSKTLVNDALVKLLAVYG